jgi:hypothetical protein
MDSLDLYGDILRNNQSIFYGKVCLPKILEKNYSGSKSKFVETLYQMYNTAYKDTENNELINHFKNDIAKISTDQNYVCKDIKPAELPIRQIYENIKQTKNEDHIFEEAFPSQLKNFIY